MEPCGDHRPGPRRGRPRRRPAPAPRAIPTPAQRHRPLGRRSGPAAAVARPVAGAAHRISAPARRLAAPSRPGPRNRTCWQTPASEATASNSRPMLDVGTQASPVRQLVRRARARSAGGQAATQGRPSSQRQPGGVQVGQRHPVRAQHAASPPAQRHVGQVREPLGSRRSRRAAPHRPRSRRRRRIRCRRRRSRSPAPSPSSPCSAITAATCAWWCCTRRSGRPSGVRVRGPAARCGSRGAGRRPAAAGRTPASVCQLRRRRARRRASVARSSMSPTCADSQA